MIYCLLVGYRPIIDLIYCHAALKTIDYIVFRHINIPHICTSYSAYIVQIGIIAGLAHSHCELSRSDLI